MIIIRKADDRGNTKTDWLQSYHTFSFADYYDSQFLGFGNLLVINEDFVNPHQGFKPHTHHDMEIITYVIEGEIQHTDSLGKNSNLKEGELQRMSAGKGIRHSESNPSDQPLHFLQIWILPKEIGVAPSHEQKAISLQPDDLILIGSAEGGDSAVKINQDVDLYTARLSKHNSIAYNFNETNYGWLQLIKGKARLNDEMIKAGDGAAIIDEERITIENVEDAEFILFDFKKNHKEQIYEI